MNTYTFTAKQLRFILADAITEYAGHSYMEFTPRARDDRDQAVDRIMANTIPTHIDEDKYEIPFLGEPPVKDLFSHEFCPFSEVRIFL